MKLKKSGAPKKLPIGGLRVLWITLKKFLGVFRRSKLGLAGAIIILVFFILAIFAPFISPYTPEYLAPNEDVFEKIALNKTYTTSGSYIEPTIGPSSPKAPDAPGGRLWIIVPHSDGIIEMHNVTKNATPYNNPNSSISIRLTDYSLAPPLSNVLYVVPGRNSVGGISFSDDLSRNGLLAFVANGTFIIMDPFTRRILASDYVGFQPTWFVQDPVSSGDMYEFPFQIGFHTYRFFIVANETRLVAYRVDYRSSQDLNPIRPGGFERLMSVDIPVTGKPLAYYLQLKSDASGFFIPTVNNTLAVFSIDGATRTDLNMSIWGEPADVCAPIGYIRAPEQQMIYVPLKSANKTGIAYVFPRNLYAGNLSIPYTLTINDTSAMVTSIPDPGNVNTPHFVLTYYSGKNATHSDMLRGSSNGTLDPVVNWRLSSPIKQFFYSPTNSLVMALDTEGTIWSAPTVSLSVLRKGIVNFFGDSNPNRTYMMYMGSAGGTKYALTLSSEEIYAFTFNPSSGNAVAFKLLGASVTPLPPGTYPSGNTYLLGTDDQGHDILTQLIWGSRIALEVGVFAAFFAVVIGTLVGLISGFYGGILDTILMRMTDVALVLPFLPLVLILAAILGPSIVNIIIVIAVLGWPGIARVIRAQTLSLKERPFIDASRISGASRSRTMRVHVAPNVLPFAFLYMTLTVGGAILTEAAVSFLGLGDPRPTSVSWGIMLRTLSSSGNTLTAWWWLLPPGLCITLISLGFYLVGRAIDEIINPRLRER